jgi:hypoxanthine phosphoribosyltransferase
VPLLTTTNDLKDFDFIVAISRGGLIPAFLIANITNIRNVDTFICQSYDEDHNKHDLVYIPKNYSHLRAKKVLIIDELVESGDSLKFAVEEIQKAFPSLIKTLVVFRKDSTKFEPDWFLKDASKDWIYFKYDEVDLQGIINYIAK